jgi:hypothetical protein
VTPADRDDMPDKEISQRLPSIGLPLGMIRNESEGGYQQHIAAS